MNRRDFLKTGLGALFGALLPKRATPQTSEHTDDGGLYELAGTFEDVEWPVTNTLQDVLPPAGHAVTQWDLPEATKQALLDAFLAVHKKATTWMSTPYVYEVFVTIRPEYCDDICEQATWCIEMPRSQLEKRG
jgi:hypothetical protein